MDVRTNREDGMHGERTALVGGEWEKGEEGRLWKGRAGA